MKKDKLIDYENNTIQYENGNNDTVAEANFKSAIEINPNDDEAYNNLGILYNKQGKDTEAELSYKSAIEINPNNEKAHGNLGNLYYKQGKYAEAEAQYKLVIEINLQSDRAYNLLGSLYRKRGMDVEAEASYKSAIEINPNNGSALVNLGNIYQKQKKDNEAEVCYKSAIEIDPNNDKALNNLGALYVEHHKDDMAEACYKSAIENNPNSDKIYFNLGHLYQRQGKESEAEASFKSALEINPNNDKALNSLGIIYGKHGKDDMAEVCYKSAIENNPNNDKAYFNLGTLYVRQGKDIEALNAFEKAYRISNNPRYNIKLAELQKKFKNYSLSLSLLLNNLGLEKIDLKVLESYLTKMKQSSEVEYQNVFSKVHRYNPLAKKVIEEVKKFEEINNKNICLGHLIKIMVNVNNFKEGLLVKNEQKSFELYQYTSLNTLKSILNLNQNDKNNITKSNILIRLYNTDYMNDPEEGKFFIDLLRKNLPNKLLESKYSVSHAFIASLTSTKDGIPMWSMYGDNSRGISIGFENLPLANKSNSDNFIADNDYAEEVEEEKDIKYNYIEEEAKLYRICYVNPNKEDWKKSKALTNLVDINESINKIFDIIENETNSECLYDIIGKFISIEFDRIKFLIKSSKYEYEHEYRILRMVKDLRDENLKLRYDLNSPKLYLELGEVKIKEIIFGVNSDDYIKWKPMIEFKLPDLEIDNIVQSEIPVRYE